MKLLYYFFSYKEKFNLPEFKRSSKHSFQNVRQTPPTMHHSQARYTLTILLDFSEFEQKKIVQINNTKDTLQFKK